MNAMNGIDISNWPLPWAFCGIRRPQSEAALAAIQFQINVLWLDGAGGLYLRAPAVVAYRSYIKERSPAEGDPEGHRPGPRRQAPPELPKASELPANRWRGDSARAARPDRSGSFHRGRPCRRSCARPSSVAVHLRQARRDGRTGQESTALMGQRSTTCPCLRSGWRSDRSRALWTSKGSSLSMRAFSCR